VISLTLVGDSGDESLLRVEDRVHHTHFQSVPGARAARKNRVLRPWPAELRQINAGRAGGLTAPCRLLCDPLGGGAAEGQCEGGGPRQQQQVGRRQQHMQQTQLHRVSASTNLGSRGGVSSLLAGQGKQTAKQSQIPDSTGHAVAR